MTCFDKLLHVELKNGLHILRDSVAYLVPDRPLS